LDTVRIAQLEQAILAIQRQAAFECGRLQGRIDLLKEQTNTGESPKDPEKKPGQRQGPA
jgi:hypothetical protein